MISLCLLFSFTALSNSGVVSIDCFFHIGFQIYLIMNLKWQVTCFINAVQCWLSA